MPGARRSLTIAVLLALATSVAPAQTPQKPQPRPHGTRVPVPAALLQMDDGDTLAIRWSEKDVEIVRMLGIDAPETRHVEHNLPYAQPFGEEARAFALGAFTAAGRVELLRADELELLGRPNVSYFVNKLLLILSNAFSYFVLFFIWSLIYFMYHYVTKSRKH